MDFIMISAQKKEIYNASIGKGKGIYFTGDFKISDYLA